MSAEKLAAPDISLTPRLPGTEDSERFRTDLTALLGRDGAPFFSATTKLGIALSGGPDSVALLLLACAAFPGQIEAATVDHRLRPEARDEAEWCASMCAALGVPHKILTVESPIEGNIQSAARAARYALLGQWMAARGVDWLLTAHHADDQAETLLMRLNRGAGVSGLAGVRARNGTTLRPLLGWRRAELQAVVAHSRLVACDDPSNRDTSYDRVRMRQALAATDWIDIDTLSISSSNLADAEAALLWIGDRLATDCIVRDDSDIRPAILLTAPLETPLETLPRELARRLVARALADADPAIEPRGEALDRLLDKMIAREKTMIGDLLITPDKSAQTWRIAPAPPRASSRERP